MKFSSKKSKLGFDTICLIIALLFSLDYLFAEGLCIVFSFFATSSGLHEGKDLHFGVI